MFFQILAAMRPRQWVKNLFVLPALIFSKHIFEWSYASSSMIGLLCFCLVSSAVYLLNDVFDLQSDRVHPEKSRRPIAAGQVPVWAAVTSALVLFVLGFIGSFSVGLDFGMVILIYAVMNLAYSAKLKHVVLIDVLIVATGFLLRALGGAVVIDVEISTWFVLCSFMLALFLTVVKRRQELIALQGAASEHRAILEDYSIPFLDQVISVLTSATLVCYALYAMGVGEGTGRQMQWTIPFVLYGVLRYLYLVYKKGDGDNPTSVIWTDRPLQLNILLWVVASGLGLYVLP